MNQEYCHLHLHTEQGSLLDGIIKIENTYHDGLLFKKGLVSRVKELGQPAVAVTDHGSVAGLISLYKECKEQKVGAILGTELYVLDGNTENEDELRNKGYHLILLAKNTAGYKNILKLNTYGAYHQHGKFPKIDYKVLKAHKEGLIVLTACAAGQMYKECNNENYERAEQLVLDLKADFGEDFYVEIQDNDLTLINDNGKTRHQKEVNKDIIKIAEKYNVKVVATGDAHYLYKEDSRAQEVALAIATNVTLAYPKRSESELMGQKEAGVKYRMAFKDEEYYVKSRAEMLERFEDKYLDVTLEILEKCCTKNKDNYWETNVHINMPGINKDDEYLMPKFQTDDPEKLLLEKINIGFKKYYEGTELEKEALKRIEFEVNVIKEMRFTDYFLIISDILDFCHKNNIKVGISRGSAAGSIICYCLFITGVCPIKNSLIFERFLNLSRRSMPDIDIDISTKDRNRVFDYVETKYTKEYTARIGAYGTHKAKSILNDVDKAYTGNEGNIENGKKIFDGKKLSAMIQMFQNETEELSDLIKKKEFKEYLPYINPEDPKFRPVVKEMFEVAFALENNNKSKSKHAAGIVISSQPIAEHCAMTKIVRDKNKDTDESSFVTQYEMSAIEMIGMIKIDLLGLNSIDHIYGTLDLIKKRHKKDIDMYKINTACAKSFDFLNKNTAYEGIFQISSPGYAANLKKMIPDRIEDIIASTALYRPGPLKSGATEMFIQRKVNMLDVKHPIYEINSILDTTYGLPIYQEQVQQICQTVCGWSLSKGDEVRSIIGKKKVDKIPKLKKEFMEDMAKNLPQYSEKHREDLWHQIESFSMYGFNRSHACAYGVTSYWMLWLKANYTIEFVCTLFNIYGTQKKYDDMHLARKDAEKLNIKILKPDINVSEFNFSVVDNYTIIYGLIMIRMVGEKAANEIVRARKDNGLFTSFKDFLLKVNLGLINKGLIKNLIKCGAFDKIETTNKNILLNSLEDHSISWKPPKTGDKYKRVIHKSILKTAKDAQDKNEKITVDELEYYEYEDIELEDYIAFNGDSLKEEEKLAKRKKIPLCGTSESILYELESTECSFNSLLPEELPKHLLYETFNIKNKKNILNRLRNARLEAGGEEQNWNHMKVYDLYKRHPKFDLSKKVLEYKDLWDLDFELSTFADLANDRLAYSDQKRSYKILMYFIYKKIIPKNYGPKKDKTMYYVQLTTGAEFVEAIAFDDTPLKIFKNIPELSKVLVLCTVSKGDQNGKDFDFKFISAIEVKEYEDGYYE